VNAAAIPKNRQKKRSSIGDFIKARRKERDLTQHQLAFYAEVSFTLVNRIENGDMNVRAQSLNKLMNIFGYELGSIPMSKKTLSTQLSQEKKV
jgi:transcriptional regulator with XRE-family HTH domain